MGGRYSALSRQNGVSFTCVLDLPPVLPVPEMDVCVVLQNLLENALEASQKLERDLLDTTLSETDMEKLLAERLGAILPAASRWR